MLESIFFLPSLSLSLCVGASSYSFSSFVKHWLTCDHTYCKNRRISTIMKHLSLISTESFLEYFIKMSDWKSPNGLELKGYLLSSMYLELVLRKVCKGSLKLLSVKSGFSPSTMNKRSDLKGLIKLPHSHYFWQPSRHPIRGSLQKWNRPGSMPWR